MILAILQARMASPRMPGKALALIRGEPMIWRQVERIRAARRVDKLIVATSAESSDDPLASFLVARGQAVFRGASINLADRFMRCVDAAGPVSYVVRLKGDSPFIDPALIDQAVELALASGAAYVSNKVEPSYPRGLEIEVATLAALAHATTALGAAQVGSASPLAWLRAHPEGFPHAHLRAPRDASAMDWRVKTPADMAFARGVYDALHGADPTFGLEAVLDVLQGRQDLAHWAAA
jgi:spore coat polysaccharide biosynthesis protein SpsF